MSKPQTQTNDTQTLDELKSAEGTALSFSDLQIPVEPLLNREQESRSGAIIRSALARLAKVLPWHPSGYRRFVARMEQVVGGGGLMFSWLPLRESMTADWERTVESLERAEKHALSRPKTAWKSLAKGVRVLETYPLDPETLVQWSREAVEGKLATGDLLDSERGQKVHRILSRLVARLEGERDNLVMPNFRLVLKEVFRYHPTGMLRSDLFQEGVLGLQKAAYRYDPAHKTRFSTYATYWIRQAIRKSLIDKARLIRVPQAVQEDLRKPEPKLASAEVDRIRRLMTETMLFSAAESDDAGDRNSFVVPDRTAEGVSEELHTETIPRVVARALEGLAGREREVILRRFGLSGEKPQTLEEIGNFLNLSRERIRQIEREALRRMGRVERLQEVYEDLGLALAGGHASRN